jgi:XTP/dITP diphosphohydrolase
MRLSNKVMIATANRGKVEEFEALFAAYPEFKPVAAEEIIRNIGKLGMAEKYDSYLENAIAKARLANQACHYPILADDSGIEVDALKGRPGVRSQRYAPPQPNKSQDEANIDLLLKEVGHGPRSARFTCTLVLLIEGIMIHATGILEGTLAEAPRGKNGFGYDPIFIPKGSTKTFAEMTDGEKNSISHRAKALHELMSKVKNHGIVLVKP